MKFKYYLRGAGFGVIVATVILSIAFLFQDNMSDAEVMRRAMELGMVMEEGTQGTLADMMPQGVTKVDMETAADDDVSSTPDTGVNPVDGQTIGDTDTPDNQAVGDTGTPDSQAANNPGSSDDHQDGDVNNSGSAGEQRPAGDTGNTDQDATDKTDGDSKPATQKPDKAKEDKDSNSDKPSVNQPDENDKNKDTVTIEVVGGDVSRVVSEKLQSAGLIDDSEEFNNYMGANGYANNIQPGTFKIKKGSSFKQIADIITSRR